MPIPFIVWAAVAGGAAYAAWVNRKKIAAYFESEEGKKLLGDVGRALEGIAEPYRNILDQCLTKDSDERLIFFRETRKRMSETNWNMLVSYGKSFSQRDLKYLAVYMDLVEVDAEPSPKDD